MLRLSTRIGRRSAPSSSAGSSRPRSPAPALGINPFDEPNVAEAKEKTKALLARMPATGRCRNRHRSARRTRQRVLTVVLRRVARGSRQGRIESLQPRDYVAFLSYLPADAATRVARSRDIRQASARRTQAASTFGVGPRYLHSTGQYHKGGPNTCVAFVITGDDETQTAIPEAGYSFSVLKRAQALGDTETLEAHDRRTVRLHVQGRR